MYSILGDQLHEIRPFEAILLRISSLLTFVSRKLDTRIQNFTASHTTVLHWEFASVIGICVLPIIVEYGVSLRSNRSCLPFSNAEIPPSGNAGFLISIAQQV